MGERGVGRNVGAPFYAPRRKTSAEIISEARAAISTEMNNVAGTGVGALRPLRTRRPFTPREPQRTLFTERTRKKDQRPPSAFDLKYLTLSETAEDALVASGSHFGCLDEDSIIEETLIELNNTKKKPAVKPQKDRLGDVWGGFPKLPHLSGRSKPLHRRNNTGQSVDAFKDLDLSQSISVSQPLVPCKGCSNMIDKKSNNDLVESVSPDSSTKKKQFLAGKSLSCDTAVGLADVSVKQLAVQLPSTITNDYENMTVLELAEALSQRNRDFEQILHLMQHLQNHIIKTSPTKSLRELVLRSLYTHIDSDDERILVAIARAMLTMRVTGAHLAAACKLIFKIARNDKNDHFFRNSNLLELLIEGSGRIEPIAESECCVYAAGALRFLALEPRLRALAHRAGALHLTALHLKIFNNAKAERPRQMTEQATHALYQVTGALRNLAARDGEKETEGELEREGDTEGRGERDGEEWDREGRTFVSSGALSELVAALTLHTDRDVLTNVARCLSVLSSRPACCAYLCASGGGARALLGALAACAPRAALAVRLAYTLGNMAAGDEQARINIYNEEGGVDVLLTILESYTQRNESECRDVESDPDLHLVGSDLGGSDGSNEDVLIKTVRVVANLCLAERAGRGLAAQHAARAGHALLSCLTLAEKAPDDKLKTLTEKERIIWLERREELATAVLATLNNVTFYLEPSEAHPEDNTLELLCKATCKWIRNKSSAACEAVRALGNLSRSRRAAQLIVLEGALDALPAFQQHEDPSVRCAAAGVLVNICAAGGVGGAGGASTGGVRGLGGAGEAAARALVAAARARDAITAALLARALWNAQAHGPLEASHARNAAAALDMFLDDDSVFTACEASKCGERRASDPQISKNHVKFQVENNNYYSESGKRFMIEEPKLAVKAYSVEGDLHLEQEYDEDGERYSGEDLGFEEGEVEECECGPCVRLAAWEELVGVAIPLLEKLRPHRADASVGTD